MAEVERDRRYSALNFHVSWYSADDNRHEARKAEETRAAFSEVSGLGMGIAMAEHSGGDERANRVNKISGMPKTPDVTLKRGIISRLDLCNWLDAVRNDDQSQLKTVSIKLMDENGLEVAQEWILHSARPIQYAGPSFNGNENDLAIEELVLSAEGITVSS